MNTSRRFCCDDETGETMTYQVDEETGEPYIEPKCFPYRLKYIEPKINNKFRNNFDSKTTNFGNVNDNIVADYNAVSYRLLLIITTIMICPAVGCTLLMMLEAYLHVKCHNKNIKLDDSSVFYRSPFHIISSIFCSWCRENDATSKIWQLQDRRRDHYDSLRRLAIKAAFKSISHSI